ncbi:hypothetical protein [Roseovarius nanhaiticus]|nr:hypothetical protein [Roseovarius nanhaiticus]
MSFQRLHGKPGQRGLHLRHVIGAVVDNPSVAGDLEGDVMP